MLSISDLESRACAPVVLESHSCSARTSALCEAVAKSVDVKEMPKGMTELSAAPRGAHLVGSVPLDTADAVFRTVAVSLSDRLRRIPDGETGERALFAGWQVATFARHPDFEEVPGRRLMEVVRPRRLRQGVDRASVHFDRLGFADA